MPEHSRTVYYYQANYGPVSGGKTEAGDEGGKEIEVTGRFGFGGCVEGGLRGGTDGRDGRDIRDGDRDGRIIK